MDIGWFAAAAAGVLLLTAVCLDCVRAGWSYYVPKYTALILTAALFAGIWNMPVTHPVRGWLSDGLEQAGQCMDNVRYGTNREAGLCDGRLREASERKTSGETMLKAAMTQPEGMYLRGFVGERYEDSRWKQLAPETLYGNMELFYWMHQNGRYGQTQLAYFAARQQKWTENVVQVENTGADRRYVYAPYEMAQCAWLDDKMSGDENVRSNQLTGCKSYTLTALSGIRTQYARILEQDGMDESSEQLHYREWVYQNYMDVPQELQRQFQSVLERTPQQNIGICEAKQLVLQYLKTYMTYDEAPGRAPEDTDALVWYMTGAGKGYDVQYASIAALMFRYLGIPARYVEGYLITDEMAQNAGSGRVISLDGSAGHAWAEIYIDGVGFVPFEAVDAYRSLIEEAQDVSIQDETGAADDGLAMPEPEDGVSEELKKPEGGGAQSLEMEAEKKENASSLRFILLLTAVLAAIIVLIILIFMKFAKISKKRQIRKQKDRRTACQLLFSEIMKMLLKSGLQWDMEDNSRSFEMAAQRYTPQYAGQLQKLWELHERIRFGGMEVSEELYESFERFYDETRKIVRKRNRKESG